MTNGLTPGKVKDMFKTQKNPIRTQVGKGDVGYDNARENIDPHVITKTIDTQDGSIQKVPINSKDIVNKEYVDSLQPLMLSGGVVFVSGSVLDTDSNLSWDNTNKRLGVGTAHPAYTFDAAGNGRFTSGNIWLNNDENFGISRSSNNVLIKAWEGFKFNMANGDVNRLNINSAGDFNVNVNEFIVNPASNTITLSGTMLMKSDVWHKSLTDSRNRLYFQDSSHTYFGTGSDYIFRSAADKAITEIRGDGSVFHLGLISGQMLIMQNQTANPSTQTNAGLLFCSGGQLWYKGTSGTETKIADA